MAGHVGRPRKNSPRRRGNTAREEILDASAELFTRQGFATTSTHQIADAVGIRQASLYYHFPSKTEIFLTLMQSTVEPSMRLAEKLVATKLDPAMCLWALVASETQLLLSTRWNLGRLYQLPTAAGEEFDEFHKHQAELQSIFQDLSVAVLGDPEDPRAQLPYYVARTVTDMRPNDGSIPYEHDPESLPPTSIMLADAALRCLDAPLPEDRVQRCIDLLKELGEA